MSTGVCLLVDGDVGYLKGIWREELGRFKYLAWQNP